MAGRSHFFALAVLAVSTLVATSTAFSPSIVLSYTTFSRNGLSWNRLTAPSSLAAFSRGVSQACRIKAADVIRFDMAMMGGRRGGEEPTRDDQSGDENKENNAQLTPLVSSESLSVGSNWMGAKNDGKGPEGDTLIVSDVLLLWLWLERRLESEVQKENFEEAATLKREMKRLRVKALSMLEGKIHKAAEVMRAETSKKRRDALQRIQMDLDHALVEEDYEAAARLKNDLEVETKRRQSGVSPSKLWKKIDSVWLEGEINNKIQLLRLKEDKMLEDPINRLKHEIQLALEEDDFTRAAGAQAKLVLEENRREVEKMEKQLARECSYKRLEDEKLRQDPMAFLEDRLLHEICAEDFEAASGTRQELQSLKVDAVLDDVTSRAKIAREEMERMGPVLRLETELETALADEDYERAGQIRDAIFSVDDSKRLQKDLNDAVRQERYEDAEGLKYTLKNAYLSSLSPAVLSELGFSYQAPKFRIGHVVKHSGGGYRGVVVGWHDRCRASEYWVNHMGIDSLPSGRNQRFYHVLPDTRHMTMKPGQHGTYSKEHVPAFVAGMSADDPNPSALTTYVPEDLLQEWDWEKTSGDNGFFAAMLRSVLPESPVVHPLVATFFFSYVRGRYLHGGKVRSLVFYHVPCDYGFGSQLL